VIFSCSRPNAVVCLPPRKKRPGSANRRRRVRRAGERRRPRPSKNKWRIKQTNGPPRRCDGHCSVIMAQKADAAKPRPLSPSPVEPPPPTVGLRKSFIPSACLGSSPRPDIQKRTRKEKMTWLPKTCTAACGSAPALPDPPPGETAQPDRCCAVVIKPFNAKVDRKESK
jgi:hypothetical protein